MLISEIMTLPLSSRRWSVNIIFGFYFLKNIAQTAEQKERALNKKLKLKYFPVNL